MLLIMTLLAMELRLNGDVVGFLVGSSNDALEEELQLGEV